MARAQRGWMVAVAWINLVAAAAVPLMLLAGDRGLGWDGLWRAWVWALVYANAAGVPAVFVGRRLVARLVARKVPPVLAVLAGTLLLAALGSLMVQALLTWAGLAAAGRFWPQVVQILCATALLSIGCGLGAMLHDSTRTRLREAETQLHAHEMARERTRVLAVEARLRSLEARLHPHFFFNTLNSISALIAVDPPRAERLVGRLATLLRSSLDTTGQALIPLGQELAIVEDYVGIEAVRFGDKLQGHVDVPAALHAERVPPLSIQSLVENAVKHGVTPRRGGGQVRVTARADGGRLRIEVSDSGPGFDLAAIAPGHGLDNLVERLEALFGARAHLSVLRREGRCVVEMVLPCT
ncbi:MAG TPA: histidine kinase [Kofleriaceae bacterium]|nr:histidine kinase [Kofleriaceae bacterium]